MDNITFLRNRKIKHFAFLTFLLVFIFILFVTSYCPAASLKRQIEGPSDICQGIEAEYSLPGAGKSGNFIFLWEAPEGWTINNIPGGTGKIIEAESTVKIIAGVKSGEIKVVRVNIRNKKAEEFSKPVTVFFSPQLILSAPDSICENEEVLISSTANCSWQIPTGWEVLETGPKFILTKASEKSGVFTAVSSENICSISSTVEIVVYDIPEITPVNKSICEESVTLFEVNGPEGTGYSWYAEPFGREFVNRGSPEPYNKNKYASYVITSNTLFVKWTASNGCSSDYIPVTVVVGQEQPKVSDMIIEEGKSAILTASSHFTSNNYKYLWYTSNSHSAAPVDTGQTFETPALAENSTYYVSILNTDGGCYSPKATVNITVLATENEANLPIEEVAEIPSYPNPFNETTTIDLKNYTSNVIIEVVDQNGVIVETMTNAMRSAELGSTLKSGMYLVRISSADNINTFRVYKQ